MRAVYLELNDKLRQKVLKNGENTALCPCTRNLSMILKNDSQQSLMQGDKGNKQRVVRLLRADSTVRGKAQK